MKDYKSLNLKELKSLDNLILTQNEFRELILNRNIKYLKYLN